MRDLLPPVPAARRAPLPALLWIGALALAARVILVLAIDRDRFPLNDTFFYHVVAGRLADGGGFELFAGQPTARWPPAYPFLLSLVYRVTGPEPPAGELLNAALGTITVVVLTWLTWRLAGRAPALLAGIACALLPGQLLYADVLLAETLFALLVVLVLAAALALRPASRSAVATCGVLIGLAALTRTEGLLLALVPVAAWWDVLPRRVLVARGAAVAGIAVLLLVPWTVRNAARMDAFVPVATNGSQTFWAGHNDRAYGGPNYPPASFIARLRESPRTTAGELEQARLLRSDAVSWAIHHPLGELSLIPRRLVYLLRGDGEVVDVWVNPVKAGLPLGVSGGEIATILADACWYLLLGAFVLALMLIGRGGLLATADRRAVLALLGSSMLMSVVVLYGNYRYRMPLEAPMLLLTAPALVALWRRRAEVRTAIPTAAGDG